MFSLSTFESILFYLGIFGFSAEMLRADIKNKFWKFILVILPPLFLATFRYNVGYDYGSYISGFKQMSHRSWASIFKNANISSYLGFNVLQKFASMFKSERVFLFIISFFAIAPGTLYILRDWEDREEQWMIMFFFLFSPFVFSLSACKQGIALSILIYSLTYVYGRKPVKFILCVLFASLFHPTAMIFFPVYFFANEDYSVKTWKRVLIIGAAVFVILNLNTVLSNFLGGRFLSYATENVKGQNRTFYLYGFLAIVCFYFRKKLIEVDKRNEMLIILLIIGAIFQYLGFSNAFAKRIGEYFMFAQIFLLPQIHYVFNQRSRKLVNLLLMVYIFAIFLITYPASSSGMSFIPYIFKFY